MPSIAARSALDRELLTVAHRRMRLRGPLAAVDVDSVGDPSDASVRFADSDYASVLTVTGPTATVVADPRLHAVSLESPTATQVGGLADRWLAERDLPGFDMAALSLTGDEQDSDMIGALARRLSTPGALLLRARDFPGDNYEQGDRLLGQLAGIGFAGMELRRDGRGEGPVAAIGWRRG